MALGSHVYFDNGVISVGLFLEITVFNPASFYLKKYFGINQE